MKATCQFITLIIIRIAVEWAIPETRLNSEIVKKWSGVSHCYDYYSTTTQDDEGTPWADSLTTRVRRSGALRKCIKRDMKCTSSDVLASGQADNQLIEACGCIFIIYYRLPDAFLHIVRHSRCQSLTYRLERILRTGCSESGLLA